MCEQLVNFIDKFFSKEQNQQQALSSNQNNINDAIKSIEFQDQKQKNQFEKLQKIFDENNTLGNQIQCNKKINHRCIQYVTIMLQRNLISYTYRYKQKYKISLRQLYQFLQKLLAKDQNHIKVFSDNGYLNFSFYLFVNQNSTKEQIKHVIKMKKDLILKIIQIYENRIIGYLVNNQSLENKENLPKKITITLESIQKYFVRLLQSIKIINHIPENKFIVIQVMGFNNLYRVQYKTKANIDKNLLNLIQNGDLQNLEKKINSQFKIFDFKIIEVLSGLFFTIYLESQLESYYQFFELQRLSKYFNSQQLQQDPFEIRIGLLIQISCVYLLKYQLNLSSEFPQDDVILIDSQKQIKLDMLEYLKCSEFKDNQQKQQQEMNELLQYFEKLFPKREKQIIIDNYNISKELEDQKQLIKQKTINQHQFILDLMKIQQLIKQQIRC